MGSVYRGLTKIPDEEVLKIYKNRIIPIAYVEGQSKHNYKVICVFVYLFIYFILIFSSKILLKKGCSSKNGSIS